MEWLALQGFGQGDINDRWSAYLAAGNTIPTGLEALITAPFVTKYGPGDVGRLIDRFGNYIVDRIGININTRAA